MDGPGIDYDTWLDIRAMLCGENPEEGISPAACARRAGLTMYQWNALVTRSREKRTADEPWMWDIAEVFDQRYVLQGQTMEDEHYRRAMTVLEEVTEKTDADGETTRTVKYKRNDKLLTDGLRRRDRKYRPNLVIEDDKRDAEDMDAEEQFEAVQRIRRLREARGITDDVQPKHKYDA